VVGRAGDWATCVELAALGAMDVLPPDSPAEEIARRMRKLLGREAAA